MAGDEAEIATEFEEKLLKMIDERALQIAFCHRPAAFDSQELEDVGVPNAMRPEIRPKRRPEQVSKPHRACH